MQKLNVNDGIILLCGRLPPVGSVAVAFIRPVDGAPAGEYGLEFERAGASPTGEDCGGTAPVGRAFIE